MTLLQKLSLVATIGSATFAVAASVPSKTILPDNVIRCEPNAACVTKVAYGHNYKVLTTPRFTVMVAVSSEGSYTRADVSITNNTDMPLNLTPEDFRVEVLTPKPRILLYIPPANLVLPPPAAPHPVPPLVTPEHAAFSGPASAGANFVPSNSDVDVVYAAAKEKALQETAEKAATENHLSATSIPPNEVTRGRVYFERDKHAHLINVVLPIAGLVFEFPYAMKK